MAVISIPDASFANEKVVVAEETEDGRSQQGYTTALSGSDIVNATETIIHAITWSSTVISRACRSTLME